ncbi:MAG TPA: PP2C family protein-serine/threonine phosphatase [Mycobacteriales bacterium]|nr:PP2C family protein-serine/threonine phosphatase [Mycobacteriales bacterium]
MTLGPRRPGRSRRGDPDRLVIDLREQLAALSNPPSLPPGWALELAHLTADGAAFGGDFCVSALTRQGKLLELVLVDVSGKGIEAGTRALMLAGAVSGILGAVPPTEVLPALNAHLLRQGWDDGFGTAVHVAVTLASGDYALSVAGHPPPAEFHAGAGDWRVLESSGVLLGVTDTAFWPVQHGRLDAGDALLLYTDGCVERSHEDIDTGIDRLLGNAYRQVLQGFAGGAARLLEAGGDAHDDREIVWLWREPTS